MKCSPDFAAGSLRPEQLKEETVIGRYFHFLAYTEHEKEDHESVYSTYSVLPTGEARVITIRELPWFSGNVERYETTYPSEGWICDLVNSGPSNFGSHGRRILPRTSGIQAKLPWQIMTRAQDAKKISAPGKLFITRRRPMYRAAYIDWIDEDRAQIATQDGLLGIFEERGEEDVLLVPCIRLRRRRRRAYRMRKKDGER